MTRETNCKEFSISLSTFSDVHNIAACEKLILAYYCTQEDRGSFYSHTINPRKVWLRIIIIGLLFWSACPLLILEVIHCTLYMYQNSLESDQVRSHVHEIKDT